MGLEAIKPLFLKTSNIVRDIEIPLDGFDEDGVLISSLIFDLNRGCQSSE